MFDNASCIILAGGRSRRMGQDKSLLPLPGNECTTFVAHLASVLTAIGGEVLLVARDNAQVAAYSALTGVDIIIDKIPNQGPLMGIFSGLSAMHAKHALVVAVDMPYLQPALVAYLLSQAAGDALLIPVVDGMPQVLLAVYPRSVLPSIEERLQEGRRDPRSLLEVAAVRYVEEAQLRLVDPQLRSFVNVNTPEELQRIVNAQ